MSYDKCMTYNLAIKQLEAQEMIVKTQVADYPNLKKEHKARFHRKMHRIAYPEIYTDNVLSAEDVARKLGGLNGR